MPNLPHEAVKQLGRSNSPFASLLTARLRMQITTKQGGEFQQIYVCPGIGGVCLCGPTYPPEFKLYDTLKYFLPGFAT